MNIHDIELPPLPDWADSTLQGEDRDSLFTWASAAIEADRKRRHLKEKAQLEQEWSELKDMQSQYEVYRKCRGKPVAFSYELATTRSGDGEYTNWSPRLSYSMPNVPDGSIRNLKWLYAAPQPAEKRGEPDYFTFVVNGRHRGISETMPPDDSYDAGTLSPLYINPQPTAPAQEPSDEDLLAIQEELFPSFGVVAIQIPGSSPCPTRPLRPSSRAGRLAIDAERVDRLP